MVNKEKIYKYLIIGGGMTSQAAIKGIRSLDNTSSIGVINQEEFSHYKRPWLSKKLWNNKSVDDVWMDVPNNNLELFTNTTVKDVLTDEKKVIDEKGISFNYDKLLIASGGSPRKLPFVQDHENIIYFRSLKDYYRLKKGVENGKKVAVIGGSFIGSEIAAVLNQNNCNVTMIFPEKGICSNIFPDTLSGYIDEYFVNKGVKVINNDPLVGLDSKVENSFLLHTKNGRTIEADIVVIGIGIMPNIDFLHKTKIKTNNGVKVNNNLQTSEPDIYAAGDVALYYYSGLEKSIRFEHEDNALTMGKVARRNMAGENIEEYNHLPYFYSDLFDLGYEAVGECNKNFDIVEKWDEKYKKGRIFYLKDNIIKGIILWNRWDEVNAARKLIFKKETIKEYQNV